MNLNVVCPHCLKVNRIPKKDTYNKANCGSCKKSLLNAEPVEVDADSLGLFLANSEIPIVVDFWAPWCGPCLQMAPAFKAVSSSMSLQVQFLKVNTEEHQNLGGQYRIEGIPTMLMFNGFKETNRISGALPQSSLEAWVREHSNG
ncbi:Thioredoxin [hydrothermal vent metagenome]|uniref:Thioredoxin n=1 Tax=hydrothermal vent metagenome TaxID=652676 RepID=A0A1W1CZA8_9ZZZZ